jgi:hypothetical protein
MTSLQPSTDTPTTDDKGFNGLQLTVIVLVVIIVTAGLTFFAASAYLFPAELEPVKLNIKEKTQLDRKLRRLGWQPEGSDKYKIDQEVMEPEPYTESDKDREVTLTEKEINGLIADDPQWARRIAIDLDNDLASAKILIPIPEDFPVMPGRVLRVNAGIELRLDDARKPVIALRGVSVMGVPIPNSWLGKLKNVDLVSEYGDQGFWKAFAEGVDTIEVRQGEIYIKLRE